MLEPKHARIHQMHKFVICRIHWFLLLNPSILIFLRSLFIWNQGFIGTWFIGSWERQVPNTGNWKIRVLPDNHEGLRTRVTVLGMIFVLGQEELLWKPVNEFQSWCGIARKLPVASVALNFIGLKAYENILDNVQWSHIRHSFLKTTSNKITLFGCQTWKCW